MYTKKATKNLQGDADQNFGVCGESDEKKGAYMAEKSARE
jgi:hypothetical protein